MKNPQNITKVVFVDFDSTLINSPEPETGREIWKQKTGEEYPHKSYAGWWYKPESLSTDVFEIKPIQNTLNMMRREFENANTYVAIFTARPRKLRPELENILRVNNIIEFDELSMKGDASEKDQRAIDMLERFPNVTEVEFYDDRQKEIDNFRRFKEKTGDKGYDTKIYRVDGEQVSLVEHLQSVLKLVLEEISIYKKRNSE